jgi:hypothetical protein
VGPTLLLDVGVNLASSTARRVENAMNMHAMVDSKWSGLVLTPMVTPSA